MARYRPLAHTTVSVSALRKNPIRYIQDHPVAVTSRGEVRAYLLSPLAFEALVGQLESNRTVGAFRPSAARLREIAARGAELVLCSENEEK